MPALITNCSNNYGPYQHPKKLIPLMIIHALEGKPLPVYGDGSNVRDWLHVSDTATLDERDRTRPHRRNYNVGSGNERNNRDVVGLICDTIDRAFAGDSSLTSRFPSCPAASGPLLSRADHLCDRPPRPRSPLCDHAAKLATDSAAVAASISKAGWTGPCAGIWTGTWWRDVTSGAYKAWIDKNYGFRIAVLTCHAHPRA